ncbi:MAG: response regulator transcription factor [Actinomycetota bacterium]
MKKPGENRPPQGRKRILVVDDDHLMVDALCLFLGLEGFDVIAAYSGMGALNEIEMSAPDAIILDIQLPVLDGWQVCRHLRSAKGDRITPIIVLTGLVDHKWREVMMEAGADEFIPKPCDFRELSSLVSRLTGDGVEAGASETGRD